MPHASSRPSALGILLMSLTCPPLLCFTLLLRAAREELKKRSPTADVGKVLREEVIKGPICPAWQGSPFDEPAGYEAWGPLSPCFSGKGEKKEAGVHPLTVGYRRLLFQAHKGGGI